MNVSNLLPNIKPRSHSFEFIRNSADPLIRGLQHRPFTVEAHSQS